MERGMSKYVIKLGKDVQIVQSIIVTQNGSAYTQTEWVKNLEELNSDYINEHFGELQDDAYQRGLDDAWEAAKKIFGYEMDGGIPIDEIRKVFGYAEDAIFCTADIIRHNSAAEAITKLKAYEEKQKADDEIKVGYEMRQVTNSGAPTGLVCTVTAFDGEKMCGFSQDGLLVVCSSQVNRWWKKTGRHFGIDKILEEMRHD